MTKIYLMFAAIFISIAFSGCQTKISYDSNKKLDSGMPKIILWSWERPEDLRFLDRKKFGVAYLAETLILRNGEVIFRPRRQPLKVSPETYLIAVTRIETDKSNRPSLSEAQKNEIVSNVKITLDSPKVKAIQIDFDALSSEREFYQSLMQSLKKELPANTPLTMTALASWCAADDWIGNMPVDEAVPMAFQMGADDQPIRRFLDGGADWREPLCRQSYGIGLNEPLKIVFKPEHRFYLFNSRPWKAEDLNNLPEGVNP